MTSDITDLPSPSWSIPSNAPVHTIPSYRYRLQAEQRRAHQLLQQQMGPSLPFRELSETTVNRVYQRDLDPVSLQSRSRYPCHLRY